MSRHSSDGCPESIPPLLSAASKRRLVGFSFREVDVSYLIWIFCTCTVHGCVSALSHSDLMLLAIASF